MILELIEPEGRSGQVGDEPEFENDRRDSVGDVSNAGEYSCPPPQGGASNYIPPTPPKARADVMFTAGSSSSSSSSCASNSPSGSPSASSADLADTNARDEGDASQQRADSYPGYPTGDEDSTYAAAAAAEVSSQADSTTSTATRPRSLLAIDAAIPVGQPPPPAPLPDSSSSTCNSPENSSYDPLILSVFNNGSCPMGPDGDYSLYLQRHQRSHSHPGGQSKSRHFSSSSVSARKKNPSGNSIRQLEQFQMLLKEEEANIEANLGAFSKKLCSRCDLRNYFALIILLLVNILNYMDRYTIAGVLLNVQGYYNIDKSQAGLLQTSFIISYMLLSPVFGYLGDRYNRTYIMAGGIFFWAGVTLGSSYIPADRYYLFLFMRALVGVGEASYSTLAPTIIADLFVKSKRSRALSVFYFAIPVGTGLGYIVGSKVAELMGSWQYALRVTPGLGVACVIMLLFVVKEPARGAAEGGTHIASTSWLADLKYLVFHKSFMLTTAGFTCVAFCAGALALWAPTYVFISIRSQPNAMEESTVAMIFGLITCVAGFLGVGTGSWVASQLRKGGNPRADPLVCAVGLIASGPFIFFALWVSKHNVVAAWVSIFIGETLLSLNWAVVTDILLYIVIPTRRSSAEAVQILISHAFGDAGSPYIVGMMADAFTRSWDHDGIWRSDDYLSLQYALYTSCFVAVLGGAFFMASACFIQKDRETTDRIVKESRGLKVDDDATDSPTSDDPVLTPVSTQTTLVSVPTETILVGTDLPGGDNAVEA